ncbi:hypothetical protein RB195_024777 [Necator americanus]|uniref:Uncharacterized protein n=1 Tax=Necator americanus TaxID=51031 RepID=A0ABR1EPP6_NECAM
MSFHSSLPIAFSRVAVNILGTPQLSKASITPSVSNESKAFFKSTKLIDSDILYSRDNSRKEEAEAAETTPSEPPKMPRGTEGKVSESQPENFLAAMVEQMRIQHEEMKTLLTAVAPMQRTTAE